MRSSSYLLLYALLLIALQGLPAPAKAAGCVPQAGKAPCATKTCDNLGTSTMDSDQKNIVFCLKNDVGQLVWKPVTSSGGTPKLKNCYWSDRARPGTACPTGSGYVQSGTQVHFNGHASQNYCCQLVME